MKIKVVYEVQDGYVGGYRPQEFSVDSSEFEGMGKDEIEAALDEIIQEDFNQRITWVARDYEGTIDSILEAQK